MKKTDAKDAVLTRVSRNTRDLATAGCIATCNNQINRLQACSQKHFPARHPLGEGEKKADCMGPYENKRHKGWDMTEAEAARPNDWRGVRTQKESSLV